MKEPAAQAKFLALLRAALSHGTLVKLTLGGYCGGDRMLRNIFVRPVALRSGPRLSFVWRYATRDITRNYPHETGLTRLAELLRADFRSAHLFTTTETAELHLGGSNGPRLTVGKPTHTKSAILTHDRPKTRGVPAENSAWLQALGVTTPEGKVRTGMTPKYRQINKFVEILEHMLTDAPALRSPSLRLVDMGCGKGYLTFAAYDWLRRAGWPDAEVRGIEARAELVELCNGIARANGFDSLRFERGTIADAALDRVDVLVALHACDTATDDALAKAIRGGAAIILAAPCCHRELRSQLRPPPVLADALRHGILLERQAEFVTDALRAALLEWAGYEARVFEFIATDHTAKNLMIAATKRSRPAGRELLARRVQGLAAFYGIRTQRLAAHLALDLEGQSRA